MIRIFGHRQLSNITDALDTLCSEKLLRYFVEMNKEIYSVSRQTSFV